MKHFLSENFPLIDDILLKEDSEGGGEHAEDIPFEDVHDEDVFWPGFSYRKY